MSQKPTNKKLGMQKHSRPKDTTWNQAMMLFIVGCLAELYLLLIRRFYINGTLDQVVAWDQYVRIIACVGLGIFAAGVVLAAVFRKPGWKRTAGWSVLGAGAYLAAVSWLAFTYYTTAVGFLCAVVPAMIVLSILWLLYDRECAWSLTILGLDIIVLWVCRKGMSSTIWHSRVLMGAAAFLVFLAVMALLAWKAMKNRGLLGKLRMLPEKADPTPVYMACGISGISTILALLSTTIAYYTLWVVAVIVFGVAVYYTVKQL